MAEMEKRLLVMVNGRKKKSVREGRRMAAVAENRGHVVDLYVTQTGKAADGVLSGNIDQYDAVVAIGGDGTVLRVAEALRNKILENRKQTDPEKIKNVPKLVAPKNSVGSIQVFGTELNMPSDPEEVIDVIEHGDIQEVQLGTVSIDGQKEKIFVSNASAGLSGRLFNRDRSKGQIGGIIGYGLNVPGVFRRAAYLGGNIGVIQRRDEEGNVRSAVNRPGEKVTDVFVHNGGKFGIFPLNPDKQYDSQDLSTMIYHGKTGPRRGALGQAHALVQSFYSQEVADNEDRINGVEVVITDFSGEVEVQRDGDFLGIATKEIRFGKDSVVIEAITARSLIEDDPTLLTAH
jgi:diacylglycerol kinase family enzyme